MFSIVIQPEKAPTMLVNFQDAFIFVIWAGTEYIFASEEVSMPKGGPSEDEPAPFSSARCSLTQQRVFMLRAPFSLNYFDVFSCYFVFFQYFQSNTANFSKYESAVVFKIYTSGSIIWDYFMLFFCLITSREVHAQYLLCNAVKTCS